MTFRWWAVAPIAALFQVHVARQGCRSAQFKWIRAARALRSVAKGSHTAQHKPSITSMITPAKPPRRLMCIS